MRNILIVLLLVAIAAAAWFLLSRAPVEEAVPPPATERPEAAEPLALSGAAILSSTTRADGFVVIPGPSEGYAAGTKVGVWLYDSVG